MRADLSHLIHQLVYIWSTANLLTSPALHKIHKITQPQSESLRRHQSQAAFITRSSSGDDFMLKYKICFYYKNRNLLVI